MKKHLLIIALALACTGVSAQVSIPNGTFENWLSVTYNDLQNYRTSNVETYFNCNNVNTCERSSDAMHGLWAVKLTTVGSGENGCFGYLVNGNPEKDPPWHGGIAYTQKPTGIQGYYKSAVPEGDTALILANFSAKGVNIGFYLLKLYGTHTSYTPFSMTFSPPLPETPDSVIFAATSSNAFGGVAMTGSMLQLDQVMFTGVDSQPALMNGDFEDWVTLTRNKPLQWYVNQGQQEGVYRSNDSHKGQYALELVTMQGDDNGTTVARPAMVSTGYYQCNGNSDCYPMGGFPFSNIIDTLTFWYKYSPSSDDAGEVNLSFKQLGLPVNWAGMILQAAETYTYAELPVMNWQAPDTVIAQFQSSVWQHQDVKYTGSKLVLDDVVFKSQRPVVGLTEPASREKISVFPNPGKGTVNIKSDVRLSSVEIRSLLGELVYVAAIDGNSLRMDLGTQPNGVYFYQLKQEQKIIKMGKLVIRH